MTDVITVDDKTPGDGHESPERSACRREQPRIAVIRNAITLTDPKILSLTTSGKRCGESENPNVSTAVLHDEPAGC